MDERLHLNGGFIDGIKMFDASNGIAVGDPVGGKWTVLKTTDGGATWSPGSAPAQVGTEAGWKQFTAAFAQAIFGLAPAQPKCIAQLTAVQHGRRVRFRLPQREREF